MKCRSEPRFSRTSIRSDVDRAGMRALQASASRSQVAGAEVTSTLGSMLVSVTNFWNRRLSLA